MKDKFFSKSITFLVLGVCSLLILFYTNDSWVKLINKNTLQMNSISRVQANVTSASLWLEETLSGDTSSDINTDFFGNIKKSEALLNVLYEGGHNNQGLYLSAIADVSTKNKVKDLLSLFPNFQQVAQQRLQNKDVADVVNKLDQQFNHFYDEIINATHIINDDLIKDLEANINNKKNEYYLISIIWLLTIFIFIYLIEKLNKKQVALESSLSIERKKLENSLNERTAELCEVKLKAESAKSALDQHSLVSIADQAGNILYVNDKFVEISGYQESELIGKKHNLLNSNNQPKSYWRDMHQTVLSGKVWHDEVRNRAKNGHYYWVDTTIVPNFDSNKKVNGFTSIRTDITQQKLILENLAIAKEQAEVASVSKADFLANMSHEIRTPMNGVIGMTNLLLTSDLSIEQNKLARTVKSSAEGLLGIINDILDFSKVEAGKLDLELIPFDLGAMIEDIGASMSFQSQRKDLQLICPATPIIQQWVKADPGRLRQILTNLIGNAIKFTQKGEVAVYVTLLEQKEEQKIFRFEVKDTGIGINESQQKQLFDKFSQADNSTTRKYGGTGLGLSISKKLVELMDGEIGIESKIGQGATFWFTLPLLSAKTMDTAPTYNTTIKNEKILIVDNNETNRELMHQLHKLWHIPHTLVDNAKAALAELELAIKEKKPYTMAILDIHMPNSDGLELCQQIQKNSTLAQTKLIMASSQAQRGDATKMKKAGFKGYITKPIQQSELLNVLLMVSGIQEKDTERVTRHSAKKYEQFKAHVLVVEDNATNQLVIQGLLRGLGLTVDLAANGEEAITTLQSTSLHDLIFMDCQMPVLDGYQATAKIRDKHTGLTNSDIPIIAMTANAMDGDKQKCLDSGMDDYLSKPIDPEKVIAMLKKWLPDMNKAKIRPTDVENETIKTRNNSDDEQVIFDYEEMSTRFMNDVALIKSIPSLFYEDLVKHIDDLKISIRDNDVVQATAIMHQIKGASANVSGKALSALALKMELAGKAGNIDDIKKNIEQLEYEVNTLNASMNNTIKC